VASFNIGYMCTKDPLLEIGCSARTGAAARRDLRDPPLAAMPVEYLTPAIEGRALEVQLLLVVRL